MGKKDNLLQFYKGNQNRNKIEIEPNTNRRRVTADTIIEKPEN